MKKTVHIKKKNKKTLYPCIQRQTNQNFNNKMPIMKLN